jgi:hypothetical protein
VPSPIPSGHGVRDDTHHLTEQFPSPLSSGVPATKRRDTGVAAKACAGVESELTRASLAQLAPDAAGD